MDLSVNGLVCEWVGMGLHWSVNGLVCNWVGL